ncbi:ATP-binding protein [Salinactinospora qingdaonensis]|uniref:AAA+ ATPase domain-containing protein n=1 Tax=Salinactinospora qingdaonensis TaxID=702744 RepID=A0ABP7FQ53_9ACTN
MREPVRYSDAIRFLGYDEATVLATIDGLAHETGTDLLQARTDLVRFAHRALGRLEREAHLISRWERTRRIAAAHSMIVVTAFFESLDDTELPFELDGPAAGSATSDVSSPTHLGEFVSLLVNSAPPLPRPQRTASDARTRVRRFYARRCRQLPPIVRRMRIWEEIDENRRSAITDRLGSALTERCLRRYEELRDKLAAGFPEFAVWAGLRNGRTREAGLAETTAVGLTRLHHQLQAISTGTVPRAPEAARARAHRERLVAPIAPLTEETAAPNLPALGVAYLDPDFRVTEVTASARLHDPQWWHHTTTARDDLPEFLLGHFTAPRSLTLPLLVVGPSGCGKSALTHVLAARLPEQDFTVVRVNGHDLAEMSAAAGAEPEECLSHALAEADRGGDALPVLIIDGLEEMATRARTSRSRLLADIARFQHDRAQRERPVAVVLTCREATAAQVRFPAGTVALRLAEFSDTQIATWVATWNRVNAGYFAHHGVNRLDLAVLAPHMDLARRPLLLFLLALYDGGGNALRKLSAPLRETMLYERWLRRLADAADRSATPSGARPTGGDGDPAVRTGRIERTLLAASMMAFAMFNRDQRSVPSDVVTADRDRLVSWPARFTPPVDPTHLGCVTRSDGQVAFTHPALGEYLIARLVADELAELAEARVRELRAIRPSPPDDGFLRALLSFTPLSVSGEVPRFLSQRLGLLAPGVRDELRLMLADLLRERRHPGAGASRQAGHYAGYEPLPLPEAAQDAVYSANLMLALVAIHGGPVPLRELFGADGEDAWRAMTHLWKSQLPPEQWASLVHALDVRRGDATEGAAGQDQDLTVRPGEEAPSMPGAQSDLGLLAREAAVLADGGTQRLLHAVEPLTQTFGGDVTARPDGAASDAHLLLTLAFAATEVDDPTLVTAYERAFALAHTLDSDSRLRLSVFLLRQLRGHVHRLGARLVPLVAEHVRPLGVARRARASIRRLAEEHNEHVRAIRDVLAGRW